MQLYSSRPGVVIWQILSDVAAIATVAIAVWVSRQVQAAIASLGGFGRQIEDAGSGLATTMEDAGEALQQVPLAGDGIAQPFRDASGSADDLAVAGAALTSGIQTLAAVVGTALWLLPTLLVGIAWLLPRLRFALRARASSRLAQTREGRDLLALRALTRQPMRKLLQAVPDPVAALRAADEPALSALAALELRSAGVRAEARPGTGPGAGLAGEARKGLRP